MLSCLGVGTITSVAQETHLLFNPFRIDVDPMERLLLVNFENDPDTLYVGFEPQVFDDEVNGTGHLVIGWRKDGWVDVYHEPGLNPDPEKYDITGKGLRHMAERSMQAALFQITDAGVQAHYGFTDIHGRQVEIHISESHPRKRKPFGLLAPMGDAAEKPSSMPLVMLHDFYFVRKNHTRFEVRINGRAHQPDELPVPMDRQKMLFTRYSPEPLIATFNPASNGPLSPLHVRPQQEKIIDSAHEIALKWVENKPYISRITRHNDVHPLELRFIDAFPDITGLKMNHRHSGRFEIEGHRSVGRIRGKYTVEKNTEGVRIVLRPSGGWKPRPNKLSLRLLYRVGKVFRHWPATYEWTAHITRLEGDSFHMQSDWRRLK